MESLTLLQDGIKILKTLGPEALTVVLVIALSYLVRSTPLIENKYIPAICPLIGAAFYAIVASPGDVDETLRNPELKLAGFGVILGVLGWALHHLVIARVERRIAMWRSDKNQKENNHESNPPSI